MPIKPRDFLDIAHRLIARADEVDHRSAVSRSYYGALHSCMDLCRLMPGGYADNASTSHQSVIDQLRACPGSQDYASIRREIQGLADQLRKGKRLRTRADYKIGLSFDLPTAKMHLQKMGQITVYADKLQPRLQSAITGKCA